MFRYLYILLILSSFFEIIPQTREANFKFTYPDFIPANKEFQVSIITSKVFDDADGLKLFIKPDNNLDLISGELKINDKNFSLNFSENLNEDFLQCLINLNGPEFSPDNFFQVLLKFSSGSASQAAIEFRGEFVKGDVVLGYLDTGNQKLSKISSNEYRVELEFYQPSKLANQLCKFPANSELEISLANYSSKIIAINFWLKMENAGDRFLNIKNKSTGRNEYSFEMNSNQVLSVYSNNYRQFSLNPKFISLNDWYSVSIIFDQTSHLAAFFINNDEVSKMELPRVVEPGDLILEFRNDERITTFSIDQLRIIETNANHTGIFENSKFINFSQDSSKVLLQINFNDNDIYTLQNKSVISFSNIKISPSNAPILPRTPYLNLNANNNFYELEWGGGDFTSALNYSIERSGDGNNFETIHTVKADKNHNEKYSYITEKINTTGVIYFRIKQTNSDGSIVYSPVVKIGQGKIEDIILEQNFPNPFNPVTKIEFELLMDSEVQVVVYNLEGREIAILHRGFLSKGKYEYEFDGSELPSGIYLYKVSTPQFTQTRKMILAK